MTERNTYTGTSAQTQSWTSTTSGLIGVREVAKKDKQLQFTALLHHLSIAELRESYLRQGRNAAAGVDGVTWQAYGKNLECRLTSLHKAIQAGSYKPQPALRVMIPKADGTQRPLSLLCLEDKIVQGAMVSILGAIYEIDFLGFSYGFRPNRSQHNALDALSVGLTQKPVNWVLDLDVKQFFDRVDQSWLLRFIKHRVQDKRVIRLIRQWLKVGFLDDNGRRVQAQVGIPQGATISPLLANVYLHYVFDLWVQQWRGRHCSGDMIVVRYADDAVLGFECKGDADRFLQDLVERMNRFGLQIHPDKTRLIRVGRRAKEDCKLDGRKKPEVFDFLGFTHISGETRKGHFTVKRKTVKKKLLAKIKDIDAGIKRRRHTPLPDQIKWLTRILSGHINYFAVPGNRASVSYFTYEIRKRWMKSLLRRSQRHTLTWNKFCRFCDNVLPKYRLMHPYPSARFYAKHSR